MAAASASASGLSKAEYLRRRYLEADGPEADSEVKKRRKKKKAAKELPPGRIRIVDDDDTSWKNIPIEQEKEDEEGDDGDLPVVAEFIDERPDEVKWMEEFRTSNKWKLLGDQKKESQESDHSVTAKSTKSSEATKQKRARHSPDQSPPRRRHDSLDQSPPRRVLCDSPDQSPPRRGRRGSPDESPKRHHSDTGKNNTRSSHGGRQERYADLSPPQKKTRDSDAGPLLSQKRQLPAGGLGKQSNARDSEANKRSHSSAPSPRKRQRHDSESDSNSPPPRRSAKSSSDSDLSPPRASRSTHSQRPSSPSDLSPPRRTRCNSSDSDLSPPRRSQEGRRKDHRSKSPLDLSPPRRAKDTKGKDGIQKGPQMLSGGKAGLVSAELLRKEQHELRKQQSSSKHLEAESRHAETVFRDKSGRKRDLKQELLEQRKKAEEKSERDEQYAKWGKGLTQSRQQQQNVEDAVKEMQKPLARYIDDQDLDKMLREQEREGDPMADFLKKKKAKEKKDTKEKPRYNGPAPPLNRFNIWPGYRWDGVDRSNGFEQKRFARISSKKAVQELAYKWSVEDM
ncbi:BUD13 homolog [Lacerta agilis]|uniref:BUD13 homolog n=1 Tax=Lacerta agilis TaxID=80427 RepID=UPI00141995E7|nr:BUD13 homolog [Lacerta agilis]